MTRTIQVDEKTLKSLMTLKKELKARSYQGVITILVSQKRGLPKFIVRPFERIEAFPARAQGRKRL